MCRLGSCLSGPRGTQIASGGSRGGKPWAADFVPGHSHLSVFLVSPGREGGRWRQANAARGVKRAEVHHSTARPKKVTLDPWRPDAQATVPSETWRGPRCPVFPPAFPDPAAGFLQLLCIQHKVLLGFRLSISKMGLLILENSESGVLALMGVALRP